ncbi:type II toxin-antitoxin system RelE/ParE family toxin [Candidatus Peregrinibacteria bacterium]|nr:type II toxin-antitoxin system RelE/ParE family toxin [Candidatus Peregrinibacteria bacterium]
MFEFLITPDFTKSLEKLDFEIQKQIKEKLIYLSDQENPLFLAKRLKGYKNIFRFRAGDFRIVFRLSQKKIFLLLVKHRKDIYENL